VIDFAGNYKYKGFWADWCPNSKRVIFGGHWFNIPDLKIDYCPSQLQVDNYVNQFEISEGLQYDDYNYPKIAKRKVNKSKRR
jgi:hypothetical protein